MNDLGVTLIWCAVQVAALGGLACLLLRFSRWFAPAAAPLISVTSLSVMIGLSGASLGPWPSYFDYLPPLELSALLNSDEQATSLSPVSPPRAAPAGDLVLEVWRSLHREQTWLQSQAALGQWGWTGVFGLLFFMGFVVGMAQLTFGLLAVHSHRRRSLAVRDPGLLQLVDQLRVEMGCTRAVRVRVSLYVSTAATVGWLRPLILLPANWREWTARERRAVIAHELAHIRNNDYLAVILSQFGVAVHYYHPVVHWLAARIRLEQELAADALAAAAAGGRQSYLTTLAAMALRQENVPSHWPAPAFLPSRGALLQRIESLRSGRARPRCLSPATQYLTISAFLIFGLLLSGLRNPQADASARSPNVLGGAARAAAAFGSTIDLTWVANDAAGVIVLKPSSVWRTPACQKLARANEAADTWFLGAPPEQIEQITWVLHGPATPSRPQEAARQTVIIRSWTPQPYTTLIARLTPQAVPRRSGSAEYFVSLRSRLAYWRPDPYTIVIGREPSLRQLIVGRRGRPHFAGHKAWSEFADSELLVALEAPRAESRDQRGGESSLVMWRPANTIFHGLRFAAGLEASMVVDCRDEPTARRWADEPYAASALASTTADAVDRAGHPWAPKSGVLPTLFALEQQILASAVLARQETRLAGGNQAHWSLLSKLQLGPRGPLRDTAKVSFEQQLQMATRNYKRP